MLQDRLGWAALYNFQLFCFKMSILKCLLTFLAHREGFLKPKLEVHATPIASIFNGVLSWFYSLKSALPGWCVFVFFFVQTHATLVIWFEMKIKYRSLVDTCHFLSGACNKDWGLNLFGHFNDWSIMYNALYALASYFLFSSEVQLQCLSMKVL